MDLVLSGLATLFVVAAVSAAAPILAVLLGQRIPQLILLILGGVIIGPQVLGLEVTAEIELIKNVGLGLVFLLDYLDDTVKTPDDLTDKLKIPLLGLAPKVTSGGELIISHKVAHEFGEAFRSLRTSLSYLHHRSAAHTSNASK